MLEKRKSRIAMVLSLAVVLVMLVGSRYGLGPSDRRGHPVPERPLRWNRSPPGALRAGRRRGARQDDRSGRP